jgi:GNAT superfamily N-acetyltransferase
MMSYNPLYYARLFETCGYQKGKDAYALWGPVHEVPDLDERIAEVERQGIRLRTWSKAKAEEHVQALVDLRNQAWAHATPYAFAKATQREGRHIAASLKSVVDPEIMIWAEREGRTIGMGICLPNISPVLKALDGRYGPIRIVKALLAQRRVDALRFAEFVVDPAEHGKGLGTAMAAMAMRNAFRRGYQRAEFSWIFEDNTASLKMAQYLGGKIVRRYRIYEKDLSGD